MNYILKRTPYLALALIASYVCLNLLPDEYPFAFAACSVGIIYGVYGLVGGHDLEMGIVRGVVDDILDFVPMPLMNIEVFKLFDKSYAFVFALFVIPLLLDLIAKLFGVEEDDAATQTLKNVNNLANVVSLLYIGYEVDNYMLIYAALSGLAAHTGIVVAGKCHSYMVDVNFIAFHMLFYLTSALAIKGDLLMLSM